VAQPRQRFRQSSHAELRAGLVVFLESLPGLFVDLADEALLVVGNDQLSPIMDCSKIR
jgi:hypothetical protein